MTDALTPMERAAWVVGWIVGLFAIAYIVMLVVGGVNPEWGISYWQATGIVVLARLLFPSTRIRST